MKYVVELLRGLVQCRVFPGKLARRCRATAWSLTARPGGLSCMWRVRSHSPLCLCADQGWPETNRRSDLTAAGRISIRIGLDDGTIETEAEATSQRLWPPVTLQENGGGHNIKPHFHSDLAAISSSRTPTLNQETTVTNPLPSANKGLLKTSLLRRCESAFESLVPVVYKT